jgi:DNA/RNA endonuclease YhcR with UshA esterase domain
MKTFAACISLLILTSFVSSAQDEAEAIPEFHVTQIDKIRAAKGTKVKVYGKITRTSTSANTGTNFLNFEVKDFTVVTFGRDLKAFTKGEPATLHKDKFVEVTGVIEFYKDAPQIVLKSPDHIREIPEKAAPNDDPAPMKAEKEPDPKAEEKKELPKKVDPKKYFTD